MEVIINNLSKMISASRADSALCFSSAKNDEMRMFIIFSILKEHNFIPSSRCEMKNSNTSIKSRNQGNRVFVNNHNSANEYLKAWELYSKSIAFAEDDSEELALAFANRSAVLFRLKKYPEVIEDINKALLSNYPNRLRAKLLLRKAETLVHLGSPVDKESYEGTMECIQKIPSNDMNLDKLKCEIGNLSRSLKPEVIKTSDPVIPEIIPQEEIPCATDALTVKYNDSLGRHVIAVRNIQPGEILAVENPYASSIVIENMYSHCAHCLRIAWASIPCKNCVYMVYCSEECRNVALEEYHDIECPIFGLLLNLGMNKLSLFSIKLTILAVREFSSLNQMRAELNKIDKHNGMVFIYNMGRATDHCISFISSNGSWSS